MGTILDKIFDTKKEELEDTRRSLPLATLKTRIREPSAVRDVRPALESSPPHRILAEIKRRTPFKGELRPDFDPLRLARVYAEHGACAISVLTESNYFGGRLEFLSEIRSRVDLPLLRKDFILDEYQVYESRVFGADFYLLIATWLDKNHLADLLALGRELGLSALVETHSEKDMEKAFRAEASLIGINNRDLATGKTDLEVSRRLIGMARQVPGTLRICESGLHDVRDLEDLEGRGAHAFLIGESLMTAADVGAKLRELRGLSKTQEAGRE